jgi:hypothetical protein
MQAFDLEYEAIGATLGGSWDMTLWGVAFEDFLGRQGHLRRRAEIVAEDIHTAMAVFVAAARDMRRDQHPAIARSRFWRLRSTGRTRCPASRQGSFDSG